MLFILPFLVYISILWIILDRYHQKFDSRILILLASVIWGTLLTLFTEVLSILNRFEFVYLVTAWGVSLLFMGGYLFIKKQKPRFDFSIKRLERLGYFQIVCILGVMLLTGIIAFVAAPNNWDSMVYHMSRVAHWVQNRSVDFYPTSIIRQLYLPPWSEYAIANFQILSGGDRFSNIPQWLSMVGSVLGVSLIAKTLGAGMRGQIISSLVAATIPMGILQSTTTQNDYVVTYWLVCMVSFIFQYRIKKSWILILGVGMSLGLAALTKSTAYIFALPFVLYLGILGFRRYDFGFWKQICIITLFFFSLNMPHYARNFNLFQNPLGPDDEVSLYRNEVFNIPSILSNVLRNLGLYIGTFEPLNNQLNKAYEVIHESLGLELNDPRITWEDHRFKVDTPKVNEDLTGSNLHFLLIAITVALLIFNNKKSRTSQQLIYAVLLLCGFILFCSYLRWQQWHPRLHLPLFVLFSAIAGVVAEMYHVKILWGVSLVLIVFTLPIFYLNPSKPLFADWTIFNLPRREVMIMRKNLVVPYIEGVNYLINEETCFEVGLNIQNEEWEYPFWSLYQDTGLPFRMEHIDVENDSSEIQITPFEPCALISTHETNNILSYNSSEYVMSWSMEPVYIHLKR